MNVLRERVSVAAAWIRVKLLFWWERPASRRSELAALRLELLAADGPERVSEEELSAARHLKQMKVHILGMLGSVHACSSCGVGMPEPFGHWDGGSCCGTDTFRVFSHLEVAVLRASGCLPHHLRPPVSSVHAGCVFRGPTGCSLPPDHRPTVCLRYTCRSLMSELRQRGDWSRVHAYAEQMRGEMERFERAREQRVEKKKWEKARRELQDLERH